MSGQTDDGRMGRWTGEMDGWLPAWPGEVTKLTVQGIQPLLLAPSPRRSALSSFS